MAKKNGNEELLYVSTTLPTIPADFADAAYNLVTNLLTWSVGIESSEIDGSDKDTGAFGDPFVGTKAIKIDATFNRDFVSATGQAAIETAALATTAATQTLWWIKTTTVSGDTGRHGSARVLSFSLGSDNGAIGTGSLSMGNIGAYTTFVEA